MIKTAFLLLVSIVACQSEVITIKKLHPTFRLCDPSKEYTLSVCLDELKSQYKTYTILSTNWSAPSVFSTECVLSVDVPNATARIIDVNQTQIIDALRTETVRNEIESSNRAIKVQRSSEPFNLNVWDNSKNWFVNIITTVINFVYVSIKFVLAMIALFFIGLFSMAVPAVIVVVAVIPLGGGAYLLLTK